MEGYQFLNPAPELQVGTKAYREFRLWLKTTHQFSTRMRLTTLKNEFLIKYLKEYRQSLCPSKPEYNG